jgi:hypothetical protein
MEVQQISYMYCLYLRKLLKEADFFLNKGDNSFSHIPKEK